MSLIPFRFSRPDRLTVEVSGAYGTLYLHYGVLTFLPLWLNHRQVPAAQIGALMAIPLFLRLIAVAPVVAWAGRRGRVRDALTLFAILAAAMAASTGLIVDHLALLVVFTFFSLAWDQLPVLIDAFAVMAVRARNLDFGRLRVWGSLGVVGGALGAGVLFQATGIQALPWAAAALLVLLAALSRLLPPDSRLSTDDEAPSRGDWKAVVADRQMMGALIATSLVAGSHGVILNFGAIQWAAKGWSTGTTGMLISVGVLSEIVVLWFGQKLLRGRDPRVLILIAGGFAVLRWVVMAFNPALPVVFALQLLNAITAIAPLLAMMLIIARRVPGPLVGVAQGVNAVVLGVGLALVTLTSGKLWEHGVPVAYGAMALMSALALPLVLGKERPPISPASETAS
jgi:PPP family 3-phenylpropionic acid transporter